MTLASWLDAAGPAVDLWCQSLLWLGSAWIVVALLRRASAARRHFVWSLALGGLVMLPLLSGRALHWSVLDAAPTLAAGPAGGAPPKAGPDAPPTDGRRGDAEALVARTGAGAAPGSAAGPDEPTEGGAHAAGRPTSASLADPGTAPRAPHLPAVGEGLASGPPADVTAPPSTTEAAPIAAGATASPAAWLGWLWLAGALLIVTPWLLGAWLTGRWTRGARPAPADEVAAAVAALGRERGPAVLISARVGAPLTCGLLRPAVLLPLSWCTESAERRRLILLHELAHALRGDVLSLAVGRLGLAVAWWQPLAWVAFARLRLLAEQACDDRVLAATSDAAPSYARCLVDVARAARTPAWVGGVAMARRSQLEWRVRAILAEGLSRRGVDGRLRVAGGSAALSLLLVCAGLDVLAPAAGAGDPPIGPPAIGAATAAEPQPGDPTMVDPTTVDPVPSSRTAVPHGAGVAASGGPTSAELSVEPDGSGTHASLAEALSAAGDGDVIRLGPGTFEGSHVIERSVTLRGAGAGVTVLSHPFGEDVDPQAAADMRERMAAATTSDEREALRAEAMRSLSPCVLRIEAGDVLLEGLTVSMPGAGLDGRVQSGAAVMSFGDGVTLRRVAVVGSPASGVQHAGGALTVEDCLIAACHATGLAILPGEGRVEVRDSDLRDGRHRCLTIGRDDVLVTGCRISGSAWHGIRYDGCSPTIRGNAIFANARSGIYASGTTAARVEDNLFLENTMTGMSCWYRNGDAIRNNTFAHNQRSGLEVLGASRPTVEANLFVWNPTGVRAGDIGGSGADIQSPGLVPLAANHFHGNGTDASTAGEAFGAATLEAGSGDPGFADVPGRDFRLVDGGVGRTRGLGVADPPTLVSPWPPQPQEADPLAAMAAGLGGVPEMDESVAPLSIEPLSQDPSSAPVDPYAAARPLVEALTGDDGDARFEALDALRRGLLSDAPGEAHAALVALTQLSAVEFERDSLRPRLEHLARTLRGEARVKALYALRQLTPTPTDRELLFEALGDLDGALRESASHLLATAHDMDLRDARCEAALLRLFATDDRSAIKEVLRGLWGAELSEPVVAHVLRLSHTPIAPDALYYTLSTLPTKSDAVVDRLLEEVLGVNDPQRALWGLGYGLDPVQQERVADQLLAWLLEVKGHFQPDIGHQGLLIDALKERGRPEQIPALETVAEDPERHARLSAFVREAIAEISRRHGLERN